MCISRGESFKKSYVGISSHQLTITANAILIWPVWFNQANCYLGIARDGDSKGHCKIPKLSSTKFDKIYGF